MKRLLLASLWAILILFCSETSFARTVTLITPKDTYVRSTAPTKNYGTEPRMIVDGVSLDPETRTFGEVAGLLQWDVSSIPVYSIVDSAKITLRLYNSSSGVYHIFEQIGSWSEKSVTWDDFSPGSTPLGSIPANRSGPVTIELNDDGIALVQGWIDGTLDNNGFALRAGGTNDGIGLHTKEGSIDFAKLKISFSDGPATIEQLQGEINRLSALLAGLRRKGDTLIFEGMNVQIVNGYGATNGHPGQKDELSPLKTNVNGLGNLIVGYNEKIDTDSFEDFLDEDSVLSDKTGSHNIIVGHGHNYSSFGGLVAGWDNIVSSPYSTVSGGKYNHASEFCSTVGGGFLNVASGDYSAVSGGYQQIASGDNSNVSGGFRNKATGFASHVSGGFSNIASGERSSINGGIANKAFGENSTVSGGGHREASGENDWVAGSLYEKE